MEKYLKEIGEKLWTAEKKSVKSWENFQEILHWIWRKLVENLWNHESATSLGNMSVCLDILHGWLYSQAVWKLSNCLFRLYFGIFILSVLYGYLANCLIWSIGNTVRLMGNSNATVRLRIIIRCGMASRSFSHQRY